MKKIEALKILRLENITNHHNPTYNQTIEKAYFKMMRRYPPEIFPDKSREIRKAYSVLNQSDDYWKELIQQEILDLDFLIPYLKSDSSSNQMNTLLIEKITDLISDDEFLKKYSHDIIYLMENQMHYNLMGLEKLLEGSSTQLF